ncbi:CDPalcohol phosphatidyltransferase superfamily protein [Acanthamoeba castellanii str. Neff]|uniref:CDPalcohol phosphatidyltransferase superfamily protein n=1 Tax=Acanthamoeba castellanii (strain ATCC 30010 / Neff) TaxID=1257118 RepID=L8HH92_ACACF|nr:CDPalcohol phosphatidyltransferase superfamily protein [Acanthamoeba castellanii str. Neff]ELR24540.1 CDPalcohol phosphatidyltransferase superfamily protein [Acanthamoeba castellanii str. Neff]
MHISSEHLGNLHKYKYSVIDVSPLSIYVLQPYWNYSIRFVPHWIAPNLVTLFGFFGLLANYLVVAYHLPLMEGPAPAWVFALSALAIEWYSLLDNLDGRQARRTGTSSPLGELFDHGCDCLAVAVGACTASCIYQFGTFYSMLELVTMSAAFWLASWEEYHTGTFFLGFFNGPTEGLKILLFSYLWTAFAGPQFWLQNWKAVLPFALPGEWPDWEVRTVCVFLSVTPMLVTFYYNIKSVLAHKAKTNQPVGPALKGVATFFIYWAMVALWYTASRSLWSAHPHALQMAVGIGFGEMSSRLILSHLCKMEYALLQRPMLPLALAVLCSLSPHVLPASLGVAIDEELVMWAYLAITIVGFVHYAWTIVNEITAFLGISCLSIPKAKWYKGQ